jgi:hypothetical protein
VNVFWLPKLGNSIEEYEDASAHSIPDRRFAIADGATESSFADLWALSLVNKFTSSPPPVTAPPSPFAVWVSPLQKEWHSQINWEHLPWFAEEKARGGAFATFLGLIFSPDPELEKPSFFSRMFGMFSAPKENHVTWQALAIGDSNLFQIRDNALLKSFPFVESEQFNSRPLLLSSNPSRNAQVWADIKYAEGDCKVNDVFILATDALAKWFLAQHEAGGQPWRTLYSLKTDSDFEIFVAKLRTDSLIRNDDTTLVIFKWMEGSNPK